MLLSVIYFTYIDSTCSLGCLLLTEPKLPIIVCHSTMGWIMKSDCDCTRDRTVILVSISQLDSIGLSSIHISNACFFALLGNGCGSYRYISCQYD